MENFKRLSQQNPIKTSLLVWSLICALGGVFSKKNTHYHERNTLQAQVLKKDNTNHYKDIYTKDIATLYPQKSNTTPQYTVHDTIPSKEEPSSPILSLCKLPDYGWKQLPLPIETTGQALASQLSQATSQQDKRDIDIPDYTSLLPQSAINTIGSSAICITSARQFLKCHIGNLNNLTDQAKDFFTLQSKQWYNPETKKSDGSVWYSTHFLSQNNIWYTSISPTNISTVQPWDMIYVLFGWSNYKNHRFRQDDPATHIMIGVGKQQIQFPLDKFHSKDPQEIVREFFNHRIDRWGHNLSQEEFTHQLNRIHSKFPKLTLPSVQVKDSLVTITGDMTVDEFAGKLCFRFFYERLIQSSTLPGQNWFLFSPTHIYSLTQPELFFLDPKTYIQSKKFAQWIHSSGFMLPHLGSDEQTLGEQIHNNYKEQANTTLLANRFFNNFVRNNIPLPIIDHIDDVSMKLLDQKLKEDFPLQLQKKEENIKNHNNNYKQPWQIIAIDVWYQWPHMINQIETYIKNYDPPLWERYDILTDKEKKEIINTITKGLRIVHSDNTYETIGYGTTTLQSYEHIIVSVPDILHHVEQSLILFEQMKLPSIPKEYYPIDYYPSQIINSICSDRPDIAWILYGIITSETPWSGIDLWYKRKTAKLVLEDITSSEGIYQMRPQNYSLKQYREAIDYMMSNQFKKFLHHQLPYYTTQELESYRKKHGGTEIEKIALLIQDNNWDNDRSSQIYDESKTNNLYNLFDQVIDIKSTYTKDDIIWLSFSTYLIKNDIIEKKLKLVKNLSTITGLSSIELTQDDAHRRSIDEILRMMHNTGPTTMYKKLIVLYLDQILQERNLTEDKYGNKWSLPNYESDKFGTQYHHYIETILSHLQDIIADPEQYTNSTYHTAQDFLSTLQSIDFEDSKHIQDFLKIQKLLYYVQSRHIAIGTTAQSSFLPKAELLYTHPLFQYYIARANIDKSEENVPNWLFYTSILLAILFMSILWWEYIAQNSSNIWQKKKNTV